MSSLPLLNLTPSRKERLTRFLDIEIARSLDARTALLSELRVDDDFYDAIPKAKNFPWPNCSNIRIPVIRIVADALAARYINTIETPRPFWTIRPTRSDAVNLARETSNYLQVLAFRDDELDMHRSNTDILFPMSRRGTAWSKTSYQYLTGKRVMYDDDLKPLIYEAPLCDTSKVEYIPEEDMLYPPESISPQTARWKGHNIRLTKQGIDTRIRNRHWYTAAWELIKGHPAKVPMGELQRAATERQGIQVDDSLSDWWDLWEVWIPAFDLDDNGTALPICATYHAPTRTIVRLTYWHYWHNFDGFSRFRHFPSSTMNSMGIARRLRSMSRGLDTIVNQYIDNATIANTRFFKGKASEVALRGGRVPIYPNKILLLQDPKEGLIPEQLGEVYPASNILVQLIMDFIQKDGNIFDFNLGQDASLKSNVPATSVLSVLQEGNKKTDLTVRDLRAEYNKIGRMILSNLQQFSPAGKVLDVLDEETGAIVEQLFRLSPDLVSKNFGIELTASTAALNQETMKQNAVALLQLAGSYYGQILPLVQMWVGAQASGATPVAEAAAKILDSSAQMFEEAASKFDVPNPGRLTVKPDDVFGAIQGTPPPSTPGGGMVAGLTGMPGVPGAGNGNTGV